MREGISLGTLIELLEECNPDSQVNFDFLGFKPSGEVASYRGYYSHLALGWRNNRCSEEDVTVNQLITVLEKALTTEFHGWKGGEYRMDTNTPVWADNPGECTGTRISGVRNCGWRVIIETYWEG